MKQERTIKVNIEMTLHFEMEENGGMSKKKIYQRSAISAVRAHLAKYPYGRVESIHKATESE
jgi:hypothetical protein